MGVSKAGLIAEKAAECHTAAQKLFGEQFKEKTEPIRLAMTDLIQKTGCPVSEAAYHLLSMLEKKGDLNAMGKLLTLAVMADLIIEKERRGE